MNRPGHPELHLLRRLPHLDALELGLNRLRPPHANEL
jgi:hypothetical protein